MRITLLFLLVLFYQAVFSQEWMELNAEGMKYYKNGQYPEAQQFFEKAAGACRLTYGEVSHEFVTALTNVAYAQQAQANYPKAQQNFRKAFLCTQQLYKYLHIDQIEALSNLANAFLPSAHYDSCEYYLLKAGQLINKSVETGGRHYKEEIHRFFYAHINVHNSLASLYFKKGQLPQAIALMEQQRLNIQQTYPDDYSLMDTYLSTLNNLGAYYMESQDLIKAKAVIIEQVALARRKREDQLDYLQALNNLGSIYRQTDQYDSAELVYNMAAKIITSGKFVSSDLHIAILNNLGELFLNNEKYSNALQALTKAASIQEQRVALNPRLYQATLLNLSEAYRWRGDIRMADETYFKLTNVLMDEILHNFTYLSDAEKISFFRSNLSVLEYYSTFAFEAAGAFRRGEGGEAYTSHYSLGNLFNLLLITKGLIFHPGYRLKNTILSSNNELLKSNYQLWEDKKYQYANESRSEHASRVLLNSLAQEIEVLEKWLRNNSAEFCKGFVMEKKTWQDIQKALKPGEVAVEIVRLAGGLVYGALILTTKTVDGPVIALVKSKESVYLEEGYYKNYANAVSYELQDTISYTVYWEPIRKVIQGNISEPEKIDRVYFSPDGIYHQINLNTLYNHVTRQYLVDELQIHQVTNLKELLVKKFPVAEINRAVLFGRPQFIIQGTGSASTFAELPGTEKEVDEINALLSSNGWNTTLLKQKEASESKAKSLVSPHVLHFATHGFTLNNENNQDVVNVLLNSGIALAGAGDDTYWHGEDDVFTAYEMMNINLDSTHLVVLSACETGLGEFYSGEGIYGLQRALRSAGARSVLMSLWKVDDDATQKLMTRFYRLWLMNPADMYEAFRQAQQKLREVYPHPKHWGAFVLNGG